jgi:hypothetical protein
VFHSCSIPLEKRDVVSRTMVISSSCNMAVARDLDQLIQSFAAMFSDQLGTVKATVCNIVLTDDQPVRSCPYQCSPPRLQALREIVEDLLKNAVIKKSFSQYASPAFLVPKPQGGYRIVVDYRLLNKIAFDTFQMPSVQHANF